MTSTSKKTVNTPVNHFSSLIWKDNHATKADNPALIEDLNISISDTELVIESDHYVFFKKSFDNPKFLHNTLKAITRI